ncbi:glycerophosphoryl diester phosphodiesterase [Staphylococcus phage vB_ScaM-V1SC04]|nr:glycerophosphoryl diester phosphodiesterase [Staphylococcus phage vB_ScaM-V1SC04]
MQKTVEGQDWDIETYDTDSDIISMAVHGGGIEIGTTELAKLVAEKGEYNFFSFTAKLSSNNTQLHVTSTNYDAPRIIDKIQDSSHSISIHGASGTEEYTYMGGGNTALKNLIWKYLTEKGFDCRESPGNLAGVEPMNIANRTMLGMGVQLELSTEMRKAFFKDKDWSRAKREDRGTWTLKLYNYADAIVKAVTEYKVREIEQEDKNYIYPLLDNLKKTPSYFLEYNNSDVENTKAQGTEFIGAMLQLEENVTVPTSQYMTIPWSKVTYNNAEFWDSNNPTRLVVPKGITKVRVSGNALWDSNPAGHRMLRILKNGTYSLGLPYTRDVAISTAPQNGSSGVIPVKEGDYFEFEVYQGSGEDRQFRADPYTWFSIEAIELETETMEKNFMLIGHRGAPGYIDEHTIKGYQMSLDKGADYIELDLQLTKDNKLLCMHDSTIDRTTTGTGKVSDMTLSYIQTNFTSLNGEPIPSLDDVLNHFGTKVKYYIETKRPFDANMDKELLTQLKAKGLIGIGSERFQVIIQSFARESLINIHNQFSNIPLAYLTGTFSESEMDDCLSYGSYAIAPKYTTITKELVDLAHSKGLKVHAWTVNTKEEMQSLIQMGVDGFFTNYLDEYKKI